jgi:predicted GNAT family acetyltransferase
MWITLGFVHRDTPELWISIFFNPQDNPARVLYDKDMDIKEEDKKLVMHDGESETAEYVGEIDWEDFEGDYEITRTFVKPEYGHRGLAAQLVLAMVEKAQSDGKKIVPTCPYAAKWFASHLEYEALLRAEE